MDEVEELIGRLRDEIRAEVEPILREALEALTVSPEKLEEVARAICGMTGCVDGCPSARCRNGCGGPIEHVLKEYGDGARAAAIALGLRCAD